MTIKHGEQTPGQALYTRSIRALGLPSLLQIRRDYPSDSAVEALLIVYFVFVFFSCYTTSELRPRSETYKEMT